MKTRITKLLDKPFIVRLSKNGRAVSVSAAKLTLKKEYPYINKWKFTKGKHCLYAKEIVKS